MSELITAIRQAVKGMIKPDLLLGKVKSFDEATWTINVELNNGAKVDEVTIKAVMNDETTGIFVEPKVGSNVLCGMTDGKIENLTVLVYSEIENIKIVPAEKITLRADDFGGIVKSQKVHDEIKQLKDDLNDLKQIIGTWVPVTYDGGAALKGALGAWISPLPPANKIDYENENVLHG